MPPTKEEILSELRRERADFMELISSLSPEDWERPTQLKGWRVRDVVAHLLGNCCGEFDEAFRRALNGDLRPVIPGDVGVWNDAVAASRRDWPADRFCQEYERASADIVAVIERWEADMETPVRLAEPIPTRPFWLEARVFYAHIWVHAQDIRKAVGRPGGVTDERMRPVVQMLFDMMPLTFRPDLAAGLRLGVAFRLSGPGGGRWLVEIEGGRCAVRPGEDRSADLTFRGTAWNFYRIGQGLVSPAVAILTLKLIPIGNPLTALRFAGLFRTAKTVVKV